MQQLEGWFAGGEDGQGAGVKIEFWGGEPFVYWKLLKPLGEAVKARYPNAQLSIVTNGSLFDDEKLAWVEAPDPQLATPASALVRPIASASRPE